MKTYKASALSGAEMGVTEQGLALSVGPNVTVAHKARRAEAIAEPVRVAPRNTGAAALAGGPNTGQRGALQIGKAQPSLAGSQSRLSLSFGAAA